MSSMIDIKPNLFVIGAPKCGTTSVANWLSQHPDIFMSKDKEPHYFYSPRHKERNLQDYLSNFFEAGAEVKYVGEASVWYLFSGIAAKKIMDFNSDSRFIVCIRNPIEMAPSLHAQMVYNGHEKETCFAKAWELSDKRESGFPEKIFNLENGDPTHMSYRKACKLGSQVENLLKFVPRERIHFVVMDDIKSSPSSVWNGIQAFLGLDFFESCDFEKKNPATVRKNLVFHRIIILLTNLKKILRLKVNLGISTALKNANSEVCDYDQPSSAMVEVMKSEFASDIRLLKKSIGSVPSSWGVD